jgi:hypothetical protein
MTNKPIEDLRRYLAEEVMNWGMIEQKDAQDNLISKDYFDNEGHLKSYRENWKPDQNLSQAFEVLEEYCKQDFVNLYRHFRNKQKEGTPIDTIINHTKDGLEKDSHYWCQSRIESIIGAILKAENKTELLGVLENEV